MRAIALLSLGVSLVLSAGAAGAEGPVPQGTHRWAPDPLAAPRTILPRENRVVIEGNGTGTCCGGWQFPYTGVQPGQAYRIRTDVDHEDVACARDSLVAIVFWGPWDPEDNRSKNTLWNYLVPETLAAGKTRFEAVVAAPPGATTMTVRYTLRWTRHGRSRWTPPAIEAADLPAKKPVKICVLSAPRQPAERTAIEPFSKDLGLSDEIAQCVDQWASLVKAACRRGPQLIVTPEVVIGGKRLAEGSVTVPGPATRPFEQLARQYKVHLVLGVRQRDGDTFYNSAVLIGPEGKLLGVYQKVHLATSEGLSGVSPGDRFPVFDTPIGRVGCLICMDTTVCESARMLALNGADFICFPIMGDLRADRWSAGQPIYNEDRWKAIMRTRAIDNQVCMVVARNGAQGSCIIDRKGDILAWNEGDQEIIEATLPASDSYRIWDGGDFREVTFLLRRPHLYGVYSDESSVKPLKPLK